MTKELSIHRDRYSERRGGKSHLCEISCAKCQTPIMLYQKDGKGSLIRCYTDRVLKVQNIVGLEEQKDDPGDISNFKALNCANCSSLIGTATTYKLEDRPAFQMIRGSFSRKPFRPKK